MIASRSIKVGNWKTKKVCLIELVVDLGNWKSISLELCGDPLKSLVDTAQKEAWCNYLYTLPPLVFGSINFHPHSHTHMHLWPERL